MEVIQTYYNGYHFRSRLEARWAVFLDALGVRYEYEPEGFDLGDGLYYLPDFRVKCWGTRGSFDGPPFDLYIEIKGAMSNDDARKIKRFVFEEPDKCLVKNSLLIVDKIPIHGTACDSYVLGCYDPMPGSDLCPFNYETVDGDMFGAYPAATPDGRFYLMGDEGSYINNDHLPKIIRAYDCARQARFEHGERPQF